MTFAYHSRGHDHFWCKGCDDTCPFGPCCDLNSIPTVQVVDYEDDDIDDEEDYDPS